MNMQRISSPMIVMCLILAACSSGPEAPAGQQFFNDAKANLATPDYESALRNLDKLSKAAGEQPVGQQGVLLRVAILTALAEGSKLMADAYGAGVREPAAGPKQGQFTRMRNDYHGIARVRLLKAMEEVMGQRNKLGDKSMPLEVPFPDFSGTERAEIQNIRSGHWVADTDRYRGELETVRNALARTLARLVGAGEDVHLGRSKFKEGGVQIDPRVYLIELSDVFLRLGEIFDRRALDDPRYRRISYEVVRDNMDVALKLLAAKPDKELETKAKKIKADCEKALKTMG